MNRTKGLTPVISVILLLLITISMIGVAYVWFYRMTSQTTQGISSQINNFTQQSSKKISIESASSANGLYIRNIGSMTITADDLKAYDNGRDMGCIWTSAPVGPGGTVKCDGGICSAGQTIRVTAPGNIDETTCE